MFHTCAYYSATVPIAAVDFDMPAISDPAVTVSPNGHFIFMFPPKVIGAYALEANLTRAKIQTPKTRALANPYLRPIDRAAAVPQRANYCDMVHTPIMLNPIDETQLLFSNNAGAAEPGFGALWIDDGNTQFPRGNIFTVRGTTAFTPTLGAWSSAQITLDQVLPAGRYAVVGMELVGAGNFIGRLIFPLQQLRPGVIASAAFGNFPGDYFHRGYMGEFGQFESVAQPLIDVFCIVATANPEVYLDLIKVR